ncbi:hypothetical protein V5O48_016911, partial [Marasmius crinis-equi]
KTRGQLSKVTKNKISSSTRFCRMLSNARHLFTPRICLLPLLTNPRTSRSKLSLTCDISFLRRSATMTLG